MSQSSHSSSLPGSVAFPQASHTVHSRHLQPLLRTTLVICRRNNQSMWCIRQPTPRFTQRNISINEFGAYAGESRTVTSSQHLLSSSSGPTLKWAHSCTFRSLPIGQNGGSMYFHAFFRAQRTTLCYRFYAYFIDVVTGFQRNQVNYPIIANRRFKMY